MAAGMNETDEFLRMQMVREVLLDGGWHKVGDSTFKATKPSGERHYVFEEAGELRTGPLSDVLAVRDADGNDLQRF